MSLVEAALMCRGVGAGARGDRRFDRAIQMLKRAGLVEYRGGEWKRSAGERSS